MSIRPAILYAFHATDCAVCEEEMPKVINWAAARLAQVAFVPVNVRWNSWRPEGSKSVKATPTFMVMQGPEQLGVHEGAFGSEKAFEKFLNGALAR